MRTLIIEFPFFFYLNPSARSFENHREEFDRIKSTEIKSQLSMVKIFQTFATYMG